MKAFWEQQPGNIKRADTLRKMSGDNMAAAPGRPWTPSQAPTPPTAGLASCTLRLHSQPGTSLTQDRAEAQTGHLHPGSICPLLPASPQATAPSPARASPHFSLHAAADTCWLVSTLQIKMSLGAMLPLAHCPLFQFHFITKPLEVPYRCVPTPPRILQSDPMWPSPTIFPPL